MTEQTLTAPAAAAPAQVTAPPLQARPQRTSTLRPRAPQSCRACRIPMEQWMSVTRSS